MTYEGPERRGTAITEDKVALMIEQAVGAALRSHEQHLLQHIDKQFAQLKQTFADAFPGGDPHGHRMAHEKAIRDATGWEKIKADVVSKFLTGGLWVAAGWLLFLVWESFKHEVRK
jgi:hypothetical protein